jgi:hypothetical protein
LDAIGVSLANKVSKTFEISAKHAAKAVWDGYKKSGQNRKFLP